MNYQTLGERIKYHRKRLGLTQEQLAERMGVSAQAVSKWENNISCPDISILPELADLFGITVDELLGKEEKVHEAVVEEPEKSDKNFEFHYYGGKKYGIWFAAYIITIGILILVNSVCSLDVSWWTVVWTTGLLFIGAAGLFPKFSIFCLILALCGLYFLVDAYEILPFDLGWDIVLPVCVVLWGIGLLVDNLRRKKRRKVKSHSESGRKTHREYTCDDGWVRTDMSFGNFRTAVVTDCLKGGSVEANFGEFTVDFSACRAVAPQCRLNVENNFGSLTLLIPEKFSAEVQGEGNFAADAKITGQPCAEPEGIIHIDLENNFGAVELKYI